MYIIFLFIPDILFFHDDSNNPTPHVAPIWQCVVDNGILNLLPNIVTNAALNSIIAPLDGVILHNLIPIA